MSDEPPTSELQARVLMRLVATLEEIHTCMREAAPDDRMVRQMRDLLILWERLPTDASREQALGVLGDLTARYRQ